MDQRRLSALVVGNCCHDVLFLDGRIDQDYLLGGAISFVSNVFDSLSVSSSFACHYISKVGPDFLYHKHLSFSSILSPLPTTLFHAHFPSSTSPSATSLPASRADRVLTRIASCDAIFPSDLTLPSSSVYDFGLAVGVAGEITSQTLARMIDICRVVLVDVQALIRIFDHDSGTVRLIPLIDSGFYHLLPRIAFLKVSADEAPFIDIEEVRRFCAVLVTNGKQGCSLYWKDGGELHIPAFPALQQIDPTGAGDSFFAGFAAGLMHGFTIPDASLLGNFFGSLAVRQVGVPNFNIPILQVSYYFISLNLNYIPMVS